MAKKTGHKSHDKVKTQAEKARHLNSDGVNAPLKEIFEKYMKLEADMKKLNQAKRELRAKAKEEHEILSSVFMYEIAMLKKDPEQRVQFESGVKDLKSQLGYQMAMDLVIDNANKAAQARGELPASTTAARAAKEMASGTSMAAH